MTKDDTISRQAAIDLLLRELQEKPDWDNGLNQYDIESVLKSLPPAQPEIIRCRDCKYFAGEGMFCECDIVAQFDHFYCYHAERRTDE